MSHRSRIGILNENGTLQTIYLGANGYLHNAGSDLLTHWNSEKRARKLIEGGAISEVGKFFDVKEAVEYEKKLKRACHAKGLKYIGDCKQYVREYHRYAQNPFSIEMWKSLEEFYKSECWGFVFDLYLWQKGKWYFVEQLGQEVFKRGFENFGAKEPVLLKDKLKEI